MLVSGSLPMSSALTTSTMEVDSLLAAIDVSIEWRMPLTTTSWISWPSGWHCQAVLASCANASCAAPERITATAAATEFTAKRRRAVTRSPAECTVRIFIDFPLTSDTVSKASPAVSPRSPHRFLVLKTPRDQSPDAAAPPQWKPSHCAARIYWDRRRCQSIQPAHQTVVRVQSNAACEKPRLMQLGSYDHRGHTTTVEDRVKSGWPWRLAAFLLPGCATSPSATEHPARTQPARLEFSNPPQDAAGAAPVTVTFAREGDSLLAHFKVTAAAIFAKPQLARDEYPYDFDVVELFVRNAKSSDPTYYEFEVSPYDQALQVNVREPRQQYHFGVQNGFTHRAHDRAGRLGGRNEDSARLSRLGWRRAARARRQCLCGSGRRRTTASTGVCLNCRPESPTFTCRAPSARF